MPVNTSETPLGDAEGLVDVLAQVLDRLDVRKLVVVGGVWHSTSVAF